MKVSYRPRRATLRCWVFDLLLLLVLMWAPNNAAAAVARRRSSTNAGAAADNDDDAADAEGAAILPTRIADLESEMDDLETRLQTCLKEWSGAEKLLAESSRKLDAATSEADAASKSFRKRFDEQRRSNERELVDVETRLAKEAAAREGELQKDVAALKSKLSARAADHEATVARLSADAKVSELQVDEVRAELAAAHRRIRQLQQENANRNLYEAIGFTTAANYMRDVGATFSVVIRRAKKQAGTVYRRATGMAQPAEGGEGEQQP